MKTKEITLEEPHGWLAAQELLANLRECPELAPYLMPTLWQDASDTTTIDSLANRSKVCIAVGLGDTTLPAAGQRKQGGLVRVGVGVYIFQPAEGTLNVGYHQQLQQRVWLSVVRRLNRWHYTLPSGDRVKAHLTHAGEVDLSAATPQLAKSVTAAAILLEIPLQLARI